MTRRLHAVAGVLAMLTIASFWVATLGSELSGAEDDVRTVKLLIPWGLPILVPLLALAGATGHSLGRGRTGPAVARKRGRMRLVAAAGVGVLIPAALFLAWKADARAFDATFHAVQVLELAAGALNLALLGLNLARRPSADGPARPAGGLAFGTDRERRRPRPARPERGPRFDASRPAPLSSRAMGKGP